MDRVQFLDCKIGKFNNECVAAIGLDINGKVYTWGSNQNGWLGHGDNKIRKLPSQILQIKRKEINQVCMGDQFIVMLGKNIRMDEQHPDQIQNQEETH